MYFLCYVLKCFSPCNLAVLQTLYCLLLSYKPKILYSITAVRSIPRGAQALKERSEAESRMSTSAVKTKCFCGQGLKGGGHSRGEPLDCWLAWGLCLSQLWEPNLGYQRCGPWAGSFVIVLAGNVMQFQKGEVHHQQEAAGSQTGQAGLQMEPHQGTWAMLQEQSAGGPTTCANGLLLWGWEQSAEQRPGTVWAGFVPSATRQRVLRESPGSVPLQSTSRVPPLLGMPS